MPGPTTKPSLTAFQKRNASIYSLQDNRYYSTLDMLVQLQRFTMRALKGIRKDDHGKLELNLIISFSWLLALGNRLHIDLGDELFARFPGVCSYCGKAPCVCKKMKPSERFIISVDKKKFPKTVRDAQKMFEKIYPAKTRTLFEAGVHLAEEMGEVSEAIQNFSGLHHAELFDEVRLEIADYLSCLLGVANSAGIDIQGEYEKLFKNGCHVCLKTPCVCGFNTVAAFKS